MFPAKCLSGERPRHPGRGASVISVLWVVHLLQETTGQFTQNRRRCSHSAGDFRIAGLS